MLNIKENNISNTYLIQNKLLSILDEFLVKTKSFSKGVPKHVVIEYIYVIKSLLQNASSTKDHKESLSRPNASVNTFNSLLNGLELTAGYLTEQAILLKKTTMPEKFANTMQTMVDQFSG